MKETKETFYVVYSPSLNELLSLAGKADKKIVKGKPGVLIVTNKNYKTICEFPGDWYYIGEL